jgi:hypothetical protein
MVSLAKLLRIRQGIGKIKKKHRVRNVSVIYKEVLVVHLPEDPLFEFELLE